MNRRQSGLMAAAFAMLLAASTPVLAAEEPAGLAEKGEHIFRQKCVACHTVGEGDRPTGPDLAGVTERRDRQWLSRMILHPGELLGSDDPVAAELLARFHGLRMPELGISEDEAGALLAYLAMSGEKERGAAEEVAPPAPAAAGGDWQRGRALYTGAIPFAKKGAPCLACHGMAALGSAGGASFGPDLSAINEDYGPEGVASILETLPFPSMEPIYAQRPLTPSERADLTAFFAEVSGGQAVPFNKVLMLQAGAGAALLLILAAVVWRGRLRAVRRSLVEKATR